MSTIAAIATAPGRGGVAVVRVSGPDAFPIAERLTGKKAAPGRFRVAKLKDPGTGKPLDEGLVLFFKAPHSYTGEDVVEFQTHGGTVTPRRVLESCFREGARPARRGEFTERAFLNGRLDYDQAESVLDLIDAKTSRAADLALEGLSGKKTRALKALYDETLALSATLEHALDIDEGELPEDFLSRETSALEALRAAYKDAIRRAREGKMLKSGALVVLAGEPNAGKSSLLNALLGESRAIVSSRAGTTRDSIEEMVDWSGWPVRLTDTAGLRETRDAIESEGVKRAEALIRAAHVVIQLVPPDAPPPEDLSVHAIRVRSKGDLIPAEERLRADGELVVSATTGEGLGALRAAIVKRLEALAEQPADEGSDRLLAALLKAQRLLPETLADLVLAANALARAAKTLGEPLGTVYTEDLLSALFSRFCVGK